MHLIVQCSTPNARQQPVMGLPDPSPPAHLMFACSEQVRAALQPGLEVAVQGAAAAEAGTAPVVSSIWRDHKLTLGRGRWRRLAGCHRRA
jgi:hypothetical protein